MEEWGGGREAGYTINIKRRAYFQFCYQIKNKRSEQSFWDMFEWHFCVRGVIRINLERWKRSCIYGIGFLFNKKKYLRLFRYLMESHESNQRLLFHSSINRNTRTEIKCVQLTNKVFWCLFRYTRSKINVYATRS